MNKNKDKFKKGKKESFNYEFANPLTKELDPEKNNAQKNK